MAKQLIKSFEPQKQQQAYGVAQRPDLQPRPAPLPEPIDRGPHKTGNDLTGKRKG